jgi:hypothetical protein
MIRLKFLHIPFASAIYIEYIPGGDHRKYRDFFVFGVRIARWGISLSE